MITTKINDGYLKGLEVMLVAPGTVLYNPTEWTNTDVKVRLYTCEGDEADGTSM